MREPSASKRAESLAAALLLIGICAFYLATLRQGQRWGDDFALYIHHAKNIVQGLPYAGTGYLPNPRAPHLGPLVYPPGFPVLLAPVYKLFGMNLTAMKWECVLGFTGGLLFSFLLFRDRLPSGWALALVACVGLNPFLWQLRDDIVTDLIFLLFVYGSMYSICYFYGRSKAGVPASRGILVGPAIYASYAVRPLGFLVLPALLLYDLLRYRRITLFPLFTAAVTGGLMVIQRLTLPPDTRFGLFDFSPRWLILNALNYARAYRAYWLNGASNLFSYILFAAVLALTGIGLWIEVRNGIQLYDWFAAFYLLVVIGYNITVDRYLIPIVPILILYALLGLLWLTQLLSAGLRPAALGLAVAAIAFSYGTQYLRSDLAPIHEGISDPDFIATCQYIQAHTLPSDRIIFRKPRLLSLLTGRASAVYDPSTDLSELWRFANLIKADYLIQADVPQEEFITDRTYLGAFLAANRDRVTCVYQNDHYGVFRLAHPPP